ncbi:hypothetical protein J1P26_09115 [Neobacillus sp. MM2021_6]|uniref:staygreen family protein n=1 Tax=Bacillaceae TaxID=186817 RepID=UPI00140D4580|nr:MULTISPECIES: staygreen family protein [Bacillaceae]MBO0959884.1 hypothetical protein [Neobacillus sp. MM2021_6]NHC18832.1 hypothetical protein [Bacillus sp. MM2020_4]
MDQFHASKLYTMYLLAANKSLPVNGRTYTLTHSATTGELFLTIAPYSNLNAINVQIRDDTLLAF